MSIPWDVPGQIIHYRTVAGPSVRQMGCRCGYVGAPRLVEVPATPENALAGVSRRHTARVGRQCPQCDAVQIPVEAGDEIVFPGGDTIIRRADPV